MLLFNNAHSTHLDRSADEHPFSVARVPRLGHQCHPECPAHLDIPLLPRQENDDAVSGHQLAHGAPPTDAPDATADTSEYHSWHLCPIPARGFTSSPLHAGRQYWLTAAQRLAEVLGGIIFKSLVIIFNSHTCLRLYCHRSCMTDTSTSG